ncbi:MAG: DegT/DnrJ/EryC1/StrS family aminotransferase [Solobacterium sp.]|nr:DegT/DnrJ/EryC1/StrS family aminotransferase [Solobacterium sp.]
MSREIFVTRSSMPEFEEYTEEIRSVFESRWLSNMGAKHMELIRRLKEFLQVERLDLFTNGHMALELSLAALGLKGEVITTPFTFISTVHAISRNGLKPVFCDIDPETYTMDVKQIESLITENTCAIMPVHVYGNICDVEAIETIAKKHHLKVIYDAAHAFGVTYKGTGIGNFGDISCFSFHATKVFHTIEGGAAVCHDDAVAQRLWEMKDFGIHDEETIDLIGPNAKMNEFCAAMGLCNLRHVEGEIAKRGRAAARYRKNLSDVKGLTLNRIQPEVKPNYAYFPVRIEAEEFGASRDEVVSKLKEQGIYARKYFYPAVNACGCYRDTCNPDDTPVAKRYSEQVITLPMYADLAEADVDRVCEALLESRR